ncbi:uncharacterized protein (TIGR02678 family) [Murinocardiopsis flavida]|uniref:Uncharacterized protein (TIGR02678 family) n=1 Tax=Murinocardiopsis flavida TaxID=645275 RepID=A0A2P8D6K9_9ACTN|nr:DUF2398 family protein [Murinocardiopsis flavida]PSK92848.1 uncharacterized protein (TIGR02678 family) [Murinocardiopsis flavida]
MTSDPDIALIFERQGAARTLLAAPIIGARTHPEEFALVAAHSDWLIQRFGRVLGYRLDVGTDHARLAKAGLVRGVTRPPARASGAVFSPRSYAFLALTLAVLVEAPPSVALPDLAAEVRAAAAEAGLGLDPEGSTAERHAFAAALRRLTEWGAVRPVADPASGPAANGGAEVPHTRLEVDSAIARSVVANPPHSESDAGAFLGAAHDVEPADPGAAELALRRLLAETPVVYRADLSPAMRDHLARHQWRAAAELGGLLGCEAEIRAEGVALIMPDDPDRSGRAAVPRTPVFPGADPVSQAALALVGRLVERLGPRAPRADSVPVPGELLERELTAVTDPAGAASRRWARAAVGHDPDPEHLSGRVLTLLAEARLLDRVPAADGAPGEWTLAAAAARYGPRAADPGEEAGANDEPARPNEHPR